MSAGEVAEEISIRKKSQRACGKCYAVRDASTRLMQARDPGVACEPSRQRHAARCQKRQSQSAAENRSDQDICHQIVQAEPSCDRGEQLRIAAANITQREQQKSYEQSNERCQCVRLVLSG